MRFLIAILIGVFTPVPLWAEADAPAPAGSESLGGRLLDDLPGGTLASPTESEPRTQNERPTGPSLTPEITPHAEVNPELQYFPLRFDDVRAPNAAGPQQPSGQQRLASAGKGMVEAESLLRDRATAARAGETQQQVVAQLDELIAELSKQCNCSGGKPSNKPPSPSQRSQAKPEKSSTAAARGTSAARDSNPKLTSSTSKPADGSDKSSLDETIKHLWGHLPERQREQMMQSFSDEFLPKYELEIEQYYERLSEEEGQAAPRQ